GVGLRRVAAAGRRWVTAGLWLGAAVALKIWPLALLGPLLVAAERDQRFRFALATLVVPVASHAISWLLVGPATLAYLGYHGSRGIEIESFWSPPMVALAHLVGAPARAVVEHGAYHVHAAGSEAWIALSYAAM